MDAVSARLVQGGALWLSRGQQGVLDDVFVRAVSIDLSEIAFT
jgi:hypothetical protein